MWNSSSSSKISSRSRLLARHSEWVSRRRHERTARQRARYARCALDGVEELVVHVVHIPALRHLELVVREAPHLGVGRREVVDAQQVAPARLDVGHHDASEGVVGQDLLVQHEAGVREARARPLDQPRRELRLHVDEHALGHEQRRHTAADRGARRISHARTHSSASGQHTCSRTPPPPSWCSSRPDPAGPLAASGTRACSAPPRLVQRSMFVSDKSQAPRAPPTATHQTRPRPGSRRAKRAPVARSAACGAGRS